jgi:transposase
MTISAKEIASAVGWHANTVRTTQRDFIAYGKVVFLDRSGNRGRPRIMSPEDEKAILEAFEAIAKKGSVMVASEIRAAIEKKVGHKIHKATLYRILKRNKWRKVVPRPKHPKQNKDAIVAFKKRASEKG